MSLKDKILNQNKEASCKRCINFELLNNNVPYCNNSDKLILPEHVEIIRKCERFRLARIRPVYNDLINNNHI